MRKTYRFVGKAAFALLIVPTLAFCSDPEPPKGSGPLPDLSKGATAGVVVTRESARQYRQMLPPEVVDLVEQGEFSFEAVLKPREPKHFQVSSAPLSSELDVSPEGMLRAVPEKGLESKRCNVSLDGDRDAKQRAYQVMWNSVAALWEYRSFAADCSALILQKSESAVHTVGFRVERIYPLSLGASPGTLKPVFREKISATRPEAIRNLSWLTLRFFGPNEDYLWAASPVVNQIRQMTGSNRSDLMFAKAFAPDDLVGWSGKVENMEAQSLSLVSMLVPLVDGPQGVVTKTGECSKVSFANGTGIALNAQSRRFKDAAAWVPTNIVMALRHVWRLEGVSRDPYSLDARQVLYFDVDSGLPVYRVVWDQAGRLSKVTMAMLRSIADDERQSVLLWAGESIMKADVGSRLVLVVDDFSWCGTSMPGRTLNEFDPASFVAFESPPGREKKLEQRQKSDDISD